MNKKEYLLTCLAEECTEVAHQASKALRFGIQDYSPHDQNRYTNEDRILNEFNHVQAMIELLVEEGIITGMVEDRGRILEKKNKVKQYMEYSKQKGCLI